MNLSKSKFNQYSIPKEWMLEAGLTNFKLTSKSFNSTQGAIVVSLSNIEPPFRNEGVRPFDHDRMIQILKGIKVGDLIPPIEVNELSEHSNYRFKLYDGFHRFYASAAVGFTTIPVIIRPVINLDEI